MTPRPCARCGAPGVRSLAAESFCGIHLAELLDGFDPSIWSALGVGLPRGLVRPEYGSGCADLTCIACGATWVGVPGDPCGWCKRHRQLLADQQRRMLLRRPEIDPDHGEADTVMMAWGERLQRAVTAGVLSRHEAERAWRRAVHHVAA